MSADPVPPSLPGIVQQGVSAAANPPCSASSAGRDTVMLCLLTDGVEKAFERLVTRGGCTVEQPPRENARFGIFNCLLRDPDGYLVELQSFAAAEEQELFCGCRPG